MAGQQIPGVVTSGDQKVITSSNSKNTLVKQLLLLKDSLMRIKLPEGYIKNYKEFISDLTVEDGSYLFSEEAYKTLKYQVHIRRRQSIDKLVGYSKLNDSKIEIEIDGKNMQLLQKPLGLITGLKIL